MTTPEFAFATRPGSDSRSVGAASALLVLSVPIVFVAYLSLVLTPNGLELASLLLAYCGPIFVAHRSSARLVTREFAETVPSRAQKSMLLSGLTSILIAATLLALVGREGWLELASLRSLALGGVASALCASQLTFYRLRANLHDTSRPRSAGAEARQASAPGISRNSRMADRMRIAVMMPTLLGALIVLDYGAHAANTRVSLERLSFTEAAVEALAQTDAELPMADRIAQALPREAFRPGRLRAVQFDPERLTEADHEVVPKALLELLDEDLEQGSQFGSLTPRGVECVASYRTQDDGRVLLVRIDSATSVAGAWIGVFVLAGIALSGFLFGGVVASDLSRAIGSIRGVARKLVEGDLRETTTSASDDEMGDLEEALVRAGAGYRAALGQARAAADHVEGTIAELGSAIGAIVDSSSSQAVQVEQAHRLMSTINHQVGHASVSAEALTHAIDESSNSVLELGAAGDELNDTASVLTSRVDAVSDSLDQMVRSVKRVGATTNRLAEASEETSSSMEEMASAMRAVDTAAETTASLSRDVVDKAELGQAKVVQTIAGMEAIREATDTAESVIRGLGVRTSEIGGILDVIEDVADETNLLALNAAIIAAQAGEQGKAFSVVADEIKELADRVLASTKEIGSLIRAVQEESENAIGAIEAGSASVMSGVDLSAEAGRTLEEITEASRESGRRISEIVSSVREQTKAASHVVVLMERVRESADEIGEASGEQDRGNEVVHRSALTMREVAQQVRRTTEDQAAGFGRIRENVVGVRGAVEQITGSLREQSEACTQVARFLDEVAAGSRSNEEAAQTVRDLMASLASEAEGLRGNVERFRCE